VRGFFGKRTRAVIIVVFFVSFWANAGVAHAQAAKTEKPMVKEVASVKVEEVVKKAEPANSSSKPTLPSITEGDFQRRLNILRSELLDYRADHIDRWLTRIAILFAVVGIFITIIGLIGFRNIRGEARRSIKEAKDHEAEARKHSEDAKRLLEEIKRYRDEAKDIRDETAKTAADDPERVRQVAKDVRENPQSPLIDKAIADAISLQQEQKLEEAVEKWQAIAVITEGNDNAIAARAWSSIGYLLGRQGKHAAVIPACDEALRLEPRLAGAFYNRGLAKSKLDQHKDAVEDYDEALRLDPKFFEGYNNRGAAKGKLGRYKEALMDFDTAVHLKADDPEVYKNRALVKRTMGQYKAAIEDCDKAIGLKSNYAKAYHERGLAHLALRNKDAARQDFEKTRDLAHKAGEEELATLLERELKKLDEE